MKTDFQKLKSAKQDCAQGKAWSKKPSLAQHTDQVFAKPNLGSLPQETHTSAQIQNQAQAKIMVQTQSQSQIQPRAQSQTQYQSHNSSSVQVNSQSEFVSRLEAAPAPAKLTSGNSQEAAERAWPSLESKEVKWPCNVWNEESLSGKGFKDLSNSFGAQWFNRKRAALNKDNKVSKPSHVCENRSYLESLKEQQVQALVAHNPYGCCLSNQDILTNQPAPGDLPKSCESWVKKIWQRHHLTACRFLLDKFNLVIPKSSGKCNAPIASTATATTTTVAGSTVTKSTATGCEGAALAYAQAQAPTFAQNLESAQADISNESIKPHQTNSLSQAPESMSQALASTKAEGASVSNIAGTVTNSSLALLADDLNNLHPH